MWARSEKVETATLGSSESRSGDNANTPALELSSFGISVSLVELDRNHSVAGQWYSDDTVAFNWCMTGRPANARGRFEAMDGGFHGVGDLFFLPVGQRYLARGGPSRQHTMFVELRSGERWYDPIDTAEISTRLLPTCMNLPVDRMRTLLRRMAQEVREPGFASELLLEGLGVTLLAETLRLLRSAGDNTTRIGGLAPWRLRAIEARIRDGDSLPTLVELAEICGLSRRHLMRAFHQETGRTVGQFIQAEMMTKAGKLLRENDATIGEVAARCGFSSATSFATAFRRASGLSPRMYRASRAIGQA